MAFDSRSFLKSLTTQPGVYQMYDGEGAILYVGKAKNLKNRVASYFRASGLTRKTEALVRRIESIEVTVAPSEAEALVLEHNLIKTQKPPFNIQLRDDKSFPYIFLSSQDKHPRLSIFRGAKRRDGEYFGPFPNVSAVRESLNFLQKTFGVRQCEDSVYRNRSRPCLLYQIGRCSGPCVGAVPDDKYQNDVEDTRQFLLGNSHQLDAALVARMEAASAALLFEEAAVYRDRIAALRHVQADQSIEVGHADMDAIACAVEADCACIHVLYVRQGRIIGSRSFFPKDKLASQPSDIISAFISHTYLNTQGLNPPSMVILSHAIEDEVVFGEVLSESFKRSIKVTSNVRTYRAKWLALAIETARQNLHQRLNAKQTLFKRFEELQAVLAMVDPIRRIECFDISHSSGEKTVGSCVVFDQAGARKSDYRRFNIEGIQAGDDYAAMEQVLTRRYRRIQEASGTMPDLVLIDGGLGQLTKARAVFDDLGIADSLLVGVAKGTTRKPGFETLILACGKEKVLNGDSPALHLIQQVRDEAHRFAITGHKQRRDKQRRQSTLEGIAGVGPKRRREMLKYFGGLQEVMKASAEDIAKVPGVSKKLAQEVYTALHSE